MARTGLVMRAGFALSAVLMLAAACDAPPPRAAKTIAPPKAEAIAKAAAAPKPESEPQIVVAQPSPRPEPAPGAPSVRKPSSGRHGGIVAQNSRVYRYGGQPALPSSRPHDHTRYDHAERPMSGLVHEADRGRMGGGDCDEACRDRAWFRDYNAWYQTYGRRYAEYPPPDAPPSAGHRDGPRTAYRPADARTWSERDRLDPWHGYDGHDGPQNGY